MKRRRLSHLIGMVLTFILCSLASSCQNSGQSDEPSVEFATYIKAYTGNVITAGDQVIVEFASIPEMTEAEDLMSFSPSMDGECTWLSQTRLSFVPDEGEMEPGQKYSAELRLDKLFNISRNDLKRFRFSFRTAQRQAMLKIDGLHIPYDDPENISVSGKLLLSEAVSSKEASEMLSFDYGWHGASLKVEESDDSNVHRFQITGLTGGERERVLSINLNGKKSGFTARQTEEVTIPRMENFYVTSAELIEGEDEYIEVRFSEPIAQMEDYSGLLVVAGVGRQIIEIKDNIAKIYFERIGSGDIGVGIHRALRSITSNMMEEDFVKAFTADVPKPAVELPMNGTIVPDVSSLTIPFKAVSLSAVDIKVIKIYESNILSFLQNNDLDEDDELRRFGRLVYKNTIRLDEDSALDLHKWQNFSIDLSGLIKHEPGAIYRVRLSFKQEYSLYGKEFQATSDPMINLEQGLSEEETAVWDVPYPYYYESDYDWEVYEWKDRDNPMTPSYYMVSGRFPECNFLSSNLGVIVKSADTGRLWVNVNDILSTETVKGAEVVVYSYQLQELGRASTKADGSAEIAINGKPFVVVASKNGYKSYLKVRSGEENSLSRFDIGGRKLEKGLKGFAYGERGVWRPGDQMYLTLIVDDPAKSIPSNHPAILELYTPQGQFYCKQICSQSENSFYSFTVKTNEDDPTGTWNAYFKIGGATFHKQIPVEAIKPNRLRIDLDIRNDILVGNTYSRMELTSSWLTGPAAAGLDANAEISLKPQYGTFHGYDGYIFHNPTVNFTSEPQELFSTTLDGNGKASMTVRMPSAKNAPGMLKADITTRVTEPGGDVSIISQTMPFSPFKAYVGIKMPAADTGYETDRDYTFSIATVDMDGNRVSGHRVEYTIYKIDWSWWWEYGKDHLSSYVNSSKAKVHDQGSFISGNSDRKINFNLAYPDWGRFYILVKDLDSGHTCGEIFMVDWPSWRGRADRSNPDAVTMLTFSTDKKKYSIGEECVVYIPAARNGNALVSLENGRGVISQTWVETSAESETPFRFAVTEDMAPNFYVHITLLQPHKQTADGTPVRMYGAIPVMVSDESSVLTPVIEVPDVIRPQEEFKVKVSEKNGHKMTYTLAIVDEGLLDITSFKTPDPWSYMYAREALGVSTWDIYDDVAGAYAGSFASMFRVGGDGYIDINSGKRDNRFNPVVKFIGPFTLKGSNTHKITLPMYVGSVRVMVVAGEDGAYGKAEKAVPVRSPLMILPTAPRVLGTGETVAIPVNVFAMEDDIQDVKLSLTIDGEAETVSQDEIHVRFEKSSDKLARFEIKAKDEGKVKITVKAECKGYKAVETINLEVRNPASGRISRERVVLEGGKDIELSWNSGSEWARIEAAGFPTIDYNGLYSFTSDYSHYCTEQICSRGISLLYSMKMLDNKRQEEAADMIEELLQQLYSRQDSDGGFRYWPGNDGVNLWCSAMAGHFMTAASEKGFPTSSSVFNKWKNFQKKTVKAYRQAADPYQSDLIQAYGLYVLALAGSPENGAMNRMKESTDRSSQATFTLASTYALSGKTAIAKGLVENLEYDFINYPALNRTFGTPLRDKALALEAFVRIDETPRALDLASEVAEGIHLNGYTTQTAAFAAAAMSLLAEKTSTEGIRLEISQTQTRKVKCAGAVGTWDLQASYGKAKITNKTDSPVVITLTTYHKASFGTSEGARSSGLEMSVRYYDMSGNQIDPACLKQGTDFRAEVTVTNTNILDGYRDLALTIAIPSGWEIFNERLYGSAPSADNSLYTYNDIRDDRSIYYFDLPKGQSKTFRTRLTATYEGTFALPSVACEAMYDNSIHAYSASGTAKVTR